MISYTASPDFSSLLNVDSAKALLQQLSELEDKGKENNSKIKASTNEGLSSLIKQWQQLGGTEELTDPKDRDGVIDSINTLTEEGEQLKVDWLIMLFDTLFSCQEVILVRGDSEPEYVPAYNANPARIEFAHGFFASALHEISHWCIAGDKRRQLADFGYWYAADGRSAAQQQEFEHLEIKPQALECLFTLACKRSFQVSQDNLFADFDTSRSTFADDVYKQAAFYIATPQNLPRDAKVLLRALLAVYIAQ